MKDKLFLNDYISNFDGKLWNVDKIIDDDNYVASVNKNIKYSIKLEHINDFDLIYIVSISKNIEFVIHCNYESDVYNVAINKSEYSDLELYVLCELALKDYIRMSN